MAGLCRQRSLHDNPLCRRALSPLRSPGRRHKSPTGAGKFPTHRPQPTRQHHPHRGTTQAPSSLPTDRTLAGIHHARPPPSPPPCCRPPSAQQKTGRHPPPLQRRLHPCLVAPNFPNLHRSARPFLRHCARTFQRGFPFPLSLSPSPPSLSWREREGERRRE